jgi:hypothetical protein
LFLFLGNSSFFFKGGLAVADVKEYRLNAKREHLRARIGVVLGFQAHLGGFCETIGTIIRQLSKNIRVMNFWKKLNLIPLKYHLRKLEIRSYPVNIPHHLHPTHFSSITPLSRREGLVCPQSKSSSSSSSTTVGKFEQVYTETGYFYHHDTTRDDSLFNEEDNTRLLKKTDEIRDAIEESGIRTNNEMRKVTLSLQNELEDIKRRLGQK